MIAQRMTVAAIAAGLRGKEDAAGRGNNENVAEGEGPSATKPLFAAPAPGGAGLMPIEKTP